MTFVVSREQSWAYVVVYKDEEPLFQAYPGSTGPCWNIGDAEDNVDLHVCDLDDLIGGLEALKASDAHAEHVKLWG